MNPREIAKYITDDPDIFNEMATSTAGISGGIPTVLGEPAKVTGRSKKKRKKPAVNPSTGKPTDPEKETLLGDVTKDPDKSLEEAGSEAGREARLKREKKRSTRQKAVTALSSIGDTPIYELPVGYLEGAALNPKLGNRVFGNLRKAYTKVNKFGANLDSLANVFPGDISYNKNSFMEEWRSFKTLVKKLGEGEESTRYQKPPARWGGVRNWSSRKALGEYWQSFISEVAVLYLEKLVPLWKDHENSCDPRGNCYGRDHLRFLINLINNKVSFSDLWGEHQQNREIAFKNFKPYSVGGRKRRTAPPLSPDERARWEEYQKLDAAGKAEWRGKFSHSAMFPSAAQRLKDWGKTYSKGKSKSELDSRMGFLDAVKMAKGERYYHAKRLGWVTIARTSGEDELRVSVIPENGWSNIYNVEDYESIPKAELVSEDDANARGEV